MTRTLFFFTALAAMLAAMSAVLIRLELAQPGVSLLFQDPSGAPNGSKFGRTAAFHSLTSYLAVMLLGTTMIVAARERGARLSGLFLYIGCLICIASALLIATTEIPLTLFPSLMERFYATDADWALDTSFFATDHHSLFGFLASLLANLIDPSFVAFYDLSRFLLLPAAALLWIGAYLMVSTQRGFGWLFVLCLPLIVLIVALSAFNLAQFGAQEAQVTFIVLALPLLACAGIRLVDDAPSWLLLLAFGVLATTLAQIAILVHPMTPLAAGTMADIATLYVFPLGLAWFALPALVLFRFGTRLSDASIWAISAVLTTSMIAWIAPLFYVGHTGQPYRYVDYPDNFSAANLTASIGVAVFIAVYLAIITLLMRKRA